MLNPCFHRMSRAAVDFCECSKCVEKQKGHERNNDRWISLIVLPGSVAKPSLTQKCECPLAKRFPAPTVTDWDAADRRQNCRDICPAPRTPHPHDRLPGACPVFHFADNYPKQAPGSKDSSVSHRGTLWVAPARAPADRPSSVGWLLAKGWDATTLNRLVQQEQSKKRNMPKLPNLN